MTKRATVDALIDALEQWRKSETKGWEETLEIGSVLHAEYWRERVRGELLKLVEEEEAK